MTSIHIATNDSLENIAWALAEGEHELGSLGSEATQAGGALVGWPGADCPWFVAGPSPCGELGVAHFDSLDLSPEW